MFGFKSLALDEKQDGWQLYSPRDLNMFSYHSWGNDKYVPTPSNPWPLDGTYLSAACPRFLSQLQYWRLNMLGIQPNISYDDVPHKNVYGHNCAPFGCGFHAAFDPLKAIGSRCLFQANVLAIVHGAGRIIVHEEGFRSKKMSVEAILINVPGRILPASYVIYNTIDPIFKSGSSLLHKKSAIEHLLGNDIPIMEYEMGRQLVENQEEYHGNR